MRNALEPLRNQQNPAKIALVPTMGNLHAGHISLVELAQKHADLVIVSIFVNPTQFGVSEDLDSYPRTIEADTQKLTDIGADYIFTPTVADMYPVMPPPTRVLGGGISQKLCGVSRPTHFDGVGLVVAKLFNIVKPNVAVFGQKDYQQLAIIRQLVRDLSYDIDVIGSPIIRAPDGLALSSRNQYLTESERKIAPMLNQEITRLAAMLTEARHINPMQPNSLIELNRLINESIERIEKAGFEIDYLEVLNQDLTDIYDVIQDRHLVIVTAAWLGKARLLDNQEVVVNDHNIR